MALDQQVACLLNVRVFSGVFAGHNPSSQEKPNFLDAPKTSRSIRRESILSGLWNAVDFDAGGE